MIFFIDSHDGTLSIAILDLNFIQHIIMFKLNPDLQYKNLGNSGLMVSELGFGNSGNDRISY